MYIYGNRYVYTYTHAHACMYMFTPAAMYTYVCMRIGIRAYIYTHIYMHAHIIIYIYIYLYEDRYSCIGHLLTQGSKYCYFEHSYPGQDMQRLTSASTGQEMYAPLVKV